MTEQADSCPPSLLDLQARGGDTAAAGFDFQRGVALALLPSWLAQEGFSQMICEAIGDIEVQFFNPGTNTLIELIEVKDHTVAPAEFWKEVDRFRELAIGCPGTYQRFRLIVSDLSAELKPVVNALRRVRDALPFYQHDPNVNQHSYQEWVKLIESRNHTQEEAHFLFDLVTIDTSLASAARDAEALFRQSLIEHFPYDPLPSQIIGQIYKELAQLVGQRRNQPSTRKELEALVRGTSPGDRRPSPRPVWLHTSIAGAPGDSTQAIRFEWAPFFGSIERDYPPPADWNQLVVGELEQTRAWIQTHRLVRRTHFTGNRRLSAALAIGAVFSAVAAFSIAVEYRGEIWATDDHPSHDTPSYDLEWQAPVGTDEHLVVSIGIAREIAVEVDASLNKLALSEVPTLHIGGTNPIQSPQQANLVAVQIKRLITEAVHRTSARRIDLFFAGPSYLALFLGHRLNAVASVQCYEWVSSGRYVPTCTLFSRH